MSILSYNDIDNIYRDLKSKDNLSEDMYYLYLLAPYIKSLGYDVFNINEVNMVQQGLYKVKVYDNDEVDDEESIYFIFSIKDIKEDLVSRQDGIRAYLYLDVSHNRLVLSHKVFGKWYDLYDAKFLLGEDSEEDESEERSSLVAINKLLSKSEFIKNYNDIGERYFSGIVADSLINKGVLVNDFIEEILIREIIDPSDEFKHLLAMKMKIYSLQELGWLEENISGITEDDIVHNLNNALDRGAITLGRYTKSKVKQVKRDLQNIDDKVDELKDAGFSLPGNIGFTGIEDEIKGEDEIDVDEDYNVHKRDRKRVSSRKEVTGGPVDLSEFLN